MMNDSTASYSERLQAFRKSDEARDELVSEIIKKYEELKVKYDERNDDWQNEVSGTNRLAIYGDCEFHDSQCKDGGRTPYKTIQRKLQALPDLAHDHMTSLTMLLLAGRSRRVACGKVRLSKVSNH